MRGAGLVRWALFGRPGGLRRRAVTAALDAIVRALRDEPAATPAASPSSPQGRVLFPATTLPPGSVTEALIDGDPVAVCRLDGEVFVLENTCPHAGGPLGDGTLEDGTLVCPHHGWPFDVRTGRCTLAPDVEVRRWKAWIADGQVVVDPRPLPPSA